MFKDILGSDKLYGHYICTMLLQGFFDKECVCCSLLIFSDLFHMYSRHLDCLICGEKDASGEVTVGNNGNPPSLEKRTYI